MPTSFETLDFHDFHRHELPRRLEAGFGAVAAADDLGRIGALAFRLPEGDAYTYRPRAGGVDVVPGDDEARTIIELSREDWEGIVHDLESAPGLLYAGRVRCLKGDAMRFVRWEPGLRAMFQGRPVFDPAEADLRDRHGDPLDPTRTFAEGDDDADIAHFLKTAGYVVLKGVFSPDEVARFRADGETLRAQAAEGDRESWWAKDASGKATLCRVTHAGRIDGFRRLPDDPRLSRIAALSDPPLVPRANGAEDGVSLLIKNPGIREGLSDLPWHRDCGMGGHGCMCPVLIASVFLSGNRPEGGVLKVLPGSHAGSMGFFDATDPKAPRGVPVPAGPGDVSFHYGDIMHAAPPPTGETGPFRLCLLTAYARPDAYNHRGMRSYNDALLSRDDGQVEHLQKVVERT